MTEGQIQYRPFVVHETPYCIWDVDIKERNAEFINSIDAGYFSHLANLHASLLKGDQKQYAATALRTEYYHSLETLFALICATVQDPHCIIGWLLKYKNCELSTLVQKIDIDNREPIRNRLGLEHFTWDEIAALINKFDTGNEETDIRLHQGFGRLWKNFAKDFLDDDIKNEYNSIKHGLRVSIGGSSLAMGPETTPGIPAAPEAMHTIGGSTYGTSFFVANKKGSNFQPILQSLNWNPVNHVHGLKLVSISIQNILTYIKQVNNIQQASAQFTSPENETDFDSPWRLLTIASPFRVNESDMNSITVLSKSEILSCLESESS
jgi:hypothetical protein